MSSTPARTLKTNFSIGFFGTMGNHAISVSPFAEPLRFADPFTTASNMPRLLKDEHGVDLVVHLSHGGLWENKKTIRG